MPFYVPPYLYGDSSDPLGDHVTAGAEDLLMQVGASPYPGAHILVGDAPELAGHSEGGADSLTAIGGLTFATAIGDAQTITGQARGGDDEVLASSRDHAVAYGDALTISGNGTGGDDSVTANSRFGSIAYGDAELLTANAQGGNDTVGGGSDLAITTTLFGDAETLQGHARGGNDVLSGASSSGGPHLMYGDSQVLADHAVAGDDTLVSGQGADMMWGDAAVVGPHATTGADLFVFASPNGHDQIMDFEPGKDRIELDGFGFNSFQALATDFQPTADGVRISFDANDDILLHGVSSSQLSAGDFLFG